MVLRRFSGLALLLSSPALLACGGGSEPPGPAPTSESSLPGPDEFPTPGDPFAKDGPDRQHRSALRAADRALSSLAQHRTGHYQTRMVLPGLSIAFEGDYDIARKSSTNRVTFRAEGDPSIELQMVSVDQRIWLTLADAATSDDPDSCWLLLDADLIEEETGIPLPTLSGVPAAVAVVDQARPVSVQRGSGQVTATAPLGLVAGTTTQTLADNLGIPPRSTIEVQVDVDVFDGEVTGLSTYMDSIHVAALDAGYEPRSEVLDTPGLLSGYSVDTTFTARGLPVSITAPPHDQVVPFTTGRGLDGALSACQGRVSPRGA